MAGNSVLSSVLLGDEYRKIKILCAFVGLMGLGWYHAQFSLERPEGYRAYMSAPEQYDGVRVLLPLWEVTHIRNASMYSVSKSVVGVPVIGSSEGLELGDTVTVMGNFRAEDSAVVAERRVDHPWRKAKGVLSILALSVGILLLPRFFGWSSSRVVMRG